MKILITGICGFVGSRLAHYLSQDARFPSVEICGIDNFSRSGSWENRSNLLEKGIQVVHGDIRSPSDLESLGRFDHVIDAAANPSVLAGTGTDSSRRLVENNLIGTINTLECCKRWQAGFVLLSSSRVYSIQALRGLELKEQNNAFVLANEDAAYSHHGVTEDFPTKAPVSLYGATKLASEQLALEYAHAFDFPVWVNRCGVLAGAGQFGKSDQGIFSFWLHSWREQRPLEYIGFGGRGLQVRDCLHPHDLAEAVALQLTGDLPTTPPVLNLSGGHSSATSLAQLSQWCSARWDENVVRSIETERPFDVPWIVLDNRRAQSMLGWRPQISVERILEEIAAFAEQRSDWIELSR
ncbi:MAG: NAD-dependent epimerase/dehydratase family protein [Planctomycetota bacterium]